jgi:hypothetical protein
MSEAVTTSVLGDLISGAKQADSFKKIRSKPKSF